MNFCLGRRQNNKKVPHNGKSRPSSTQEPHNWFDACAAFFLSYHSFTTLADDEIELLTFDNLFSPPQWRRSDNGYHIFSPKWRWFTREHYLPLMHLSVRGGAGGWQGMGWGFDIFQKFAVKFPVHGQIIPVKCNQISPPRGCTLLSNIPRQNPRKTQWKYFQIKLCNLYL